MKGMTLEDPNCSIVDRFNKRKFSKTKQRITGTGRIKSASPWE